MAEQPTLTQGLTSILTPLASVGATAYQAQTKSQINAARVRAGKAPCTGLPDQPSDCPGIFWQQTTSAEQGGDTSGGSGGRSSNESNSTLLILGLLVGGGILILLLLPKKKPAAARRRKR